MQEDQPAVQPPESSWQFNDGDSPSNPMTSEVSTEAPHVSWSASEFIAHEKDFSWFALLGAGTAVLMLAVYFLTRDFISTGVVLLVAVLFGAYGVHKPRVRQYAVNDRGLQIDNQQFTYDTFKSFSVIQEGGVRSIELMPLKRFMPIITIYTDPADEELIVGVLSNYLPFEQREQAFVDKLMRRLRF